MRDGYCKCGCGKKTNLRYDGAPYNYIQHHYAKSINEGKRKNPLYNVYKTMRHRCNSPKSISYKNYGAKGIKVCDEWEKDFNSFLKFALDNGWEKGLHIDRIDSNKGYEPSNCRFVTRTIQNRNSRQSKYWVVNGIKYDSAIKAARIYGVDSSTIRGWCRGYMRLGKTYIPKNGCSIIDKY